MKRHMLTIGLISVTALLIGCTTTLMAPSAAGGGQIKIAILSDRGNPKDMTPRQYQYRNEVGAWMERDLLNHLKRSGYDVSQVESQDAFKAGVDSYLLKVSIKSYNPGSSAVRMLLGFGAGAASLDNHYEFSGGGENMVMAWDDGVGTSQHWQRLPRKLNEQTEEKITQKLLSGK
jgi:hypothetical protein